MHSTIGQCNLDLMDIQMILHLSFEIYIVTKCNKNVHNIKDVTIFFNDQNRCFCIGGLTTFKHGP